MSTLHEALGDASIVITCGPGGVGKTTSAAALGLALASTSDRRVLVLTIDPAKRLADALGLTGIGNEPVAVEVDGPGSLDVAMLDTSASWDGLIRRHAPNDATAETILRNSLYQNITRRFVQSHDYVAIERVRELVESARYDLLIVDTPPTRNAIDFLEAPERMADFFSSRLLRWLLAPARGGIVGLAAKPFTQLADRVLGSGFLSDITEFFTALSSLHQGFVERARDVASLLNDDATVFLVVSTLEREPLREADFFVRELHQRSLRVVGWVANRVLPVTLRSIPEADLDVALASVAKETGGDDDATIVAALRDAYDDWSSRARAEGHELRHLDTQGVPLFAVSGADGQLGSVAGVRDFGFTLLASKGVESAEEQP